MSSQGTKFGNKEEVLKLFDMTNTSEFVGKIVEVRPMFANACITTGRISYVQHFEQEGTFALKIDGVKDSLFLEPSTYANDHTYLFVGNGNKYYVYFS